MRNIVSSTYQHNITESTPFIPLADMSEWSKEVDSKSTVERRSGSNPDVSDPTGSE